VPVRPFRFGIMSTMQFRYVLAHETTLSLHESVQNDRKPSFEFLRRHRITPQNEKASGKEHRSLGGFTYKTFEWLALMANSGRVRLC